LQATVARNLRYCNSIIRTPVPLPRPTGKRSRPCPNRVSRSGSCAAAAASLTWSYQFKRFHYLPSARHASHALGSLLFERWRKCAMAALDSGMSRSAARRTPWMASRSPTWHRISSPTRGDNRHTASGYIRTRNQKTPARSPEWESCSFMDLSNSNRLINRVTMQAGPKVRTLYQPPTQATISSVAGSTPMLAARSRLARQCSDDSDILQLRLRPSGSPMGKNP